MPSQLSQMIAEQPAVLRTLADFDVSAYAQRLRGAPRLYLAGTGTSLHAAELGAFLLRAGGLDARALACSALVRWHPPLRDGDGLILITHTGETAYALAARAAALAAATAFVSITGSHVEWGEALRTPTRERSETYTVSYTAALALLALLAHELTGIGTGRGALRALAAQVAAVIAEPGVDEIMPPRRALALLGPGPWGVSAREGALKLRESAHVLAQGFDCEQLLHGFAVPYGPGDTLVALQPQADPDGLTAALLEAARAEGITTHTLADADLAGGAAGVFLAQIPLTVRLQLLAARIVAAKGTDPDTVITGAWADQALWSAGAPAT